jgi:hypothetical protein
MPTQVVEKAKPGWDYKRVENIISHDPSLKRFLGEKTVTIEKRNGTTTAHSPELIALMEAMEQSGTSLPACPKNTVLQFAARFWIKESSGSVPTPAPLPAPSRKVTAPASPSKDAVPKREEAQKKVVKADEKPTFCAAVALANLAMSMLQLAEQYDTSPGSDKRRDKLNVVAIEYENLTKSYMNGCWEAVKHNAKG